MRQVKFRYWNGSKVLNQEAIINHLNKYIARNDKHLMQFTGLFDKQGVEIYEGDIVKADCRSGHNKDNGKYIIEYDRTNCCFYGNPRPVIQLFGLMLDVTHCEPISDLRQNIEVIGNIYEKPELLEGTK